MDLLCPDLDGKSGEAPAFVRDDLYETRQTPGAGIAAFATAFIPCGTRLFCEEALIAVPDEAWQPELFSLVSDLSTKKQADYWELAADSKPNKNMDWVNDLRSSFKGAEGSFNTLVEAHEQAWSIYETNRFSMHLPDGRYKLGVFAKAARLNHSCAPNLFHRYSPRINRLTIHTLRDIELGEELNTSYIDICHPTAVRRQLLKDWGFKCGCPACDSTDDEIDYDRKNLEDVMKKVKKREKQRQSSGVQWTDKDLQKSMKVVESGMRLMEHQGMEETDTLGYLLSLAATYGSSVHRGGEALAWVERLIQIEKKCLGEDSNEYRAALDLRRVVSQCL